VANYDGIRVIPRSEHKYVVEVGGRWYYYDRSYMIRGPFDTEEETIAALRREWEQYTDGGDGDETEVD